MLNIYEHINNLLGLDQQILSILHMSTRAIIVFFFGFIITKLNKRFLAIRTQFNFVLFIMLGSILATAITGNAPFFAVLGMTVLLVILNWLFVRLSYYFPLFENFFKGTPIILIKDGQYQWKKMQQSSITPEDLIEQLRKTRGSNMISQVKEAYMENDGSISFILK